MDNQNPEQAVADNCEHAYDIRLIGGHPLHVRSCILCRVPDWADLYEQATELYRWGWQEGSAGHPQRTHLSAYEKPRPKADQTSVQARSQWPAAQHLQQAADEIRQAVSGMPDELQVLQGPVADWLDTTARKAGWLAPYRRHEVGYLPWQIATRAAHGVLNLPDADDCTICHPDHVKPED